MDLERVTALNLLPNNRILNLLLIFVIQLSIRSFLLLRVLSIAGLVLIELSLEVYMKKLIRMKPTLLKVLSERIALRVVPKTHWFITHCSLF